MSYIGEYEIEVEGYLVGPGRKIKFICTNCDIVLPVGDGGYFYVDKEKTGNIERTICSGAPQEIRQILKPKKATEKLVNQKVGFIYNCICLDCLYQFDADYGHYYYSIRDGHLHRNGAKPEKDKRECPSCKSPNVKTIIEMEMAEQYCPRCKKGVISFTII